MNMINNVNNLYFKILPNYYSLYCPIKSPQHHQYLFAVKKNRIRF